jgi:undecaprenyl diphosphate synthase
MRLSNFLLPNIGYSELFFTEKLWPEFNKDDFVNILDEFQQRQRRFGK